MDTSRIVGDEDEAGAKEFQFGLLPPPVVLVLWDGIAQLLEEHPPRPGGELFATPEDIKQTILETAAFLWGGFNEGRLELVMICCFRKYPITRTLEVLYVGGSGLRRAFKHWPMVEKWAAECGATHIEARMSRAMERFYRPLGVKETALYYRKALVQFAH